MLKKEYMREEYMKKLAIIMSVATVVMVLALSGTAFAMSHLKDKCVACHKDVTPVVVSQWHES